MTAETREVERDVAGGLTLALDVDPGVVEQDADNVLRASEAGQVKWRQIVLGGEFLV